MEMTLHLPRQYEEIEEEEMMYIDGGAYLSRSNCRSIIAGLGMSPGTFMAAAYGAVVVKKVLKWIKAGGPLTFLVSLIGSAISGAISRVAWCIGYGALNRGADIGWSPYPWNAFVSASVR